MQNAKMEFLEEVVGKAPILGAVVQLRSGCYGIDDLEPSSIDGIRILEAGHTVEDYGDFLNKLEFEYDNGFGGQRLFGSILFKNGTWCTRGEYDGSEWWEYHQCPTMEELMRSVNDV